MKCQHCNIYLLGELVINYPLQQGKTMEEAIAYAKNYSGWEKYGVENRWDLRIGIYDIEKDRTVKYICPNCKKDL
jgi:hypothetical protein